MTGTTHQMVALLSALWLLTIYPVSLGPILATLAIIAVMIGALTPDLDQPTANVWRRMLGGRVIGNIFQAFSGGHRHMTHSLIGIIGIGLLLRWLLFTFIQPQFHPEGIALWFAFMIGYISHPIADTLTDQGVPWLWPLQVQIKVPPGPEELRVTTDSIIERVVVRGGLIVATLIILRTHWSIVVDLFA